MVEQIRQEYGLDRPLPVQFWRYLGGIFEGDLGSSLRTTHDVSHDLARYFPATFELVTFSILIAIVLGVAARRALRGRRKNLGRPRRPASFRVSGVALPMFWLGLMLQLLIALSSAGCRSAAGSG